MPDEQLDRANVTSEQEESRELGPSGRMIAFLQDRLGQDTIQTFSEGMNKATRSLDAKSEPEKNLDSPIKSLTKNYLQNLQAYRKRAQNNKIETSSSETSSRSLGFLGPPNNNWIPIGPSGARSGQAGNQPVISGRATGIVFAPNNSRIYISTSNGGIWRSLDEGRSWTSLMPGFDVNPTSQQSDSLAFGAIALEAGPSKEKDTIYGGSGEGQGWLAVRNLTSSFITGQGASYLGVGPICSKDGGLNWITEISTPNLVGEAFFAMVVDPNPAVTGRVVAATSRGIYRRELVGGIWTWVQKVLPGSAGDPGPPVAGNTWSTSVVATFNAGATTFYAISNEASQAPNINRSRLYSSVDGNAWVAVGNPLPGGNRRTTLAIQRNNPNVIYAFRSNGRVYRMDRAVNNNWRRVNISNPAAAPGPVNIPDNIVGNQGWYDLSITIDPNNINTVYVGGSTIASDNTGTLIAGGPSAATHEWSAAIYRLAVTIGGTVRATWNYIGGSCHADIHMLRFPADNPNQLWVACDGGIFMTNTPLGGGLIFQSRNGGLQTLSVNQISLHPTEEGFMFCATQDNGSLRFTGDELWQVASLGDSGATVINWNNPDQVLASWTEEVISRSTQAGLRELSGGGNWTSVDIPLGNNGVLFYAPMVGSPQTSILPLPPTVGVTPPLPHPSAIVAFGSRRAWISTTFGGNWRSVPNGNLTDRIPGGALIRSMVFANPQRFYVGTTSGRVYRYDSNNLAWTAAGSGTLTRTRIDNTGANPLSTFLTNTFPPVSGNARIPSVTDIAVDPNNSAAVFITLSGTGDFRHVWYFNGANWTAVSGPGPAGNPSTLLDVQFNALIAQPNPTLGNPNNITLYAGADIGIWRSQDGGTNWAPFSQGLPDASVLDLKLLPQRTHLGQTRPPILRAGTHGRGIFERVLNNAPSSFIELYIRDTVMDQGRYPTDVTNTVRNPLLPGNTIGAVNSPDIKIDTPDAGGNYQFPITSGREISYIEFVDTLVDRSAQVAVNELTDIRSKVYVQVHNRGIEDANEVKVYALLAPAQASVPTLPADYHQKIKAEQPVEGNGWQTVGIKSVDQVIVGLPKVVSFDLDTSFFPRSSNLAGRNQYCLMVFLHHTADEYNNAERTATNTPFLGERKASFKLLTIANYAGPVANLAQDSDTFLEGYVDVPSTATNAEVPFDPFLAEVFQQNDEFIRKKFLSIFSSPLPFNGSENHVKNPNPRRFVIARTITVNEPIELVEKVPLIWYAQEKISIQNEIRGSGKGAPSGSEGDFGGSGGGGHQPGMACRFPIRGQELVPGGTANQAGENMNQLLPDVLFMLAYAIGGASGGHDEDPGDGVSFAQGGAGGSIICLIAPEIEIMGEGKIIASGEDGGRGVSGITGNAGGGGGGTVILLANDRPSIISDPTNPNANVLVQGGAGLGSGGQGGQGQIFETAGVTT
ncbi:MAG: hypothetical protein AAGC85_04625 [Bacteroidota bacterium]